MIEIEFLGGAQTVTGSKHLVRTSGATVLLECGLFQGRRREAWAQNHVLPVDHESLDAVVLSHAHIDHSGALPLLYKQGYRGSIFATPATRDLCVPMLLDAAMIQEADARHIERLIERDHAEIEPAQMLYSRDDAVAVVEQMIAVPYRRRQVVAPGVTCTFLDAGHVLGSAIVVLDIDDEGEHTRIAFTGDLGRHHLPILRDPEVPDGAHCLIMESTYGDRLHDPIEQAGDALAEVIQRTFQRGGKVIIPSFALERAQEIIYELKQLKARGRLPNIPVYVDSPLTVKLTEVFKQHPDCYDRETFDLLNSGDSPFDFEGLHYVSDVEESKAIDAKPGPAIIISASGMCEGGRVLHHLRATIGRPENTVVIVGFQAEHTLGRRLVEKRDEVRIFGLAYRREAEVAVLNGFSAHADQAGLLDYAESVRRRGKLRRVILVHGEPGAQAALMKELDERGFPTVNAPAAGERIRL
jgi:metallo-beta-lactamase family protein